MTKISSSAWILNECEVTLSKDWQVLNRYIFSNVTCNAWRTSIAQRLHDDTAWLGVIKYIWIWTSSTVATITDTQLWTEIYRQEIDLINSSNTTTVSTIYASFPTWPTYTVYEAWVFLDASATSTLNTWSLLCHSIFWASITKPVDQVLTVKWTISINNV